MSIKSKLMEKKRRRYRYVAAFLLINIINQTVFPSISMALTSGPSQPSAMSFEPVTTNQMVDLPSGDFTYNIPLFELPGPNGSYPFNLFYNSGVTMDQEATAFGLGWNLNPGMINKNTRGIDDQSNGSKIHVTEDMKQDVTVGGSFNFSNEFFGFNALPYSLGTKFYHNNYRGLGMGLKNNLGFNGVNLGFGIDSQEGSDLSVSFSTRSNSNDNRSYTFGLGLSSKRGLAFSTSVSQKGIKGKSNEGPYSNSGGASFSFSESAFSPILSKEMRSINTSFSMGGGPETQGFFGKFGFGVFHNQRWLANLNDEESYKTYGYNYISYAGKNDITDFNREKDTELNKWSKNIGVSNYTYDTYDIKGQGIGSSFRPYRNRFGSVSDPKRVSYGGGAHVNIEVGAGSVAKLSGGGGINFNRSIVEEWIDGDNELIDSLKFKKNDNQSELTSESIYYKARGEMTPINKNELAQIGGEHAVAAKFKSTNYVFDEVYKIKDELINNTGNTKTAIGDRSLIRGKERENRNTSISELKNLEIEKLDNPGIYDFKYYPISEINNYEESLLLNGDRNKRYGALRDENYDVNDHTGAFSVLNASGLRYNYGIPVYNNEKIEEIVSVEARNKCDYKIKSPSSLFWEEEREGISFSEEYYKKTITPSEVQNYLLTNILGTDYLDIDGIPGPSDGDKGYWVKFNYLKDESYRWRAPYTEALYSPGSEITGSDDKASYVYGTRENYYLATAETKTHIAKFTMSKRHDAHGAMHQYQDESNGLSPLDGKSMYKVDRIDLYVKAEYKDALNNNRTPKPLQSVHFRYSYKLCQDVLNNDKQDYFYDINSPNKQNEGGKLTLEKVWTTYQNNNRGALSPYVFDYGFNPDYKENLYNRWGGYKVYGPDDCKNLQDPYVEQFISGHKTENSQGVLEFNPSASKKAHQDSMNLWASAWNLNKISLPSGANINIEYEADDYGYVQHKQAAQMFKISKTGSSAGNSVLYTKNGWEIDKENDNNDDLKLFFELEEPILESEYNQNKNDVTAKFFNDYIEPTKTPEGDYQLFYKTKVKLRENFEEYISGFIKINPSDFGLDENSVISHSSTDYITRGYITLEPIKSKFWTKKGDKFFHPIAYNAWQYMQQVKPDLITSVTTKTNTNLADIEKKEMKDRALAIKSFLGAFVQAGQMFKSYMSRCFKEEFAKEIVLTHSWIRLGSPDKKKIGGGSRVSKVYMEDNWGEIDPVTQEPIVYGQVYDYSMKEENRTISSGVASFEPMVGGNENILRYAKIQNRKIIFKASETSSFNYPVNEQLFPGPRVVYRQVTTKSIGTQNIIDNNSNTNIAQRARSGIKINRFATCKEFPTIVEETEIQKDNFNLWVPIPFIGLIQNSQMGASQGYSIQLNDMAGKPLSEETFKVKDDGTVGDLVSSVKYKYQADEIVYQGEDVWKLNNEVNVIKDELEEYYENNIIKNRYLKEQKLMGVEYDMYSDFRHSSSISGSLGINLDVDLILFGIPVPAVSFLPEINIAGSDLKTAVINKVIHKSGILQETVATDGQSTVSTENLLYDDLTGSLVLSQVSNNYDKPVYSMNIPAHWKYEGMRNASSNLGAEFRCDVHKTNTDLKIDLSTLKKVYKKSKFHILEESNDIDENDFINVIKPGDEVIISYQDDNYLGVFTSEDVINCPSFIDNVSNIEIDVKVIRSNRRNLLNAVVGNIVTLEDPTNGLLKEAININSLSTDEANEIAQFFKDHLNPTSNEVVGVQENDLSNYSLLDEKYSSIEVSAGGPDWRGTEYLSAVYTLNSKDGKSSYSCELAPFGVEFDRMEIVGSNNTATLFPIDPLETTKYPTDPYRRIPTDCFLKSGYVYKQSEVLQASAVEFKDEWIYSDTYAGNEYYTGEKGIWRVSSNHYYKDERFSNDKAQQFISGEHQLSRDGVFQGDLVGSMYDKMFYNFNWNKKEGNHEKWVPNETITKYNRNGFAIESKDILNNYSFAKYGYDENLVTMVGANAQESEVLFEDFETNSSLSFLSNYSLNNTYSHSGKKSANVQPGTQINSLTDLDFVIGKKYIVSFWINKKGGSPISVLTYNNSLSVFNVVDDNGVSISASAIIPTGEVIEEWQKVEGVFTPQGNGVKMSINNSNTLFIDDFKICPFKSATKSYVYDPNTFRLSAELDNNNYATFYYYDSQGSLHLTKVETSEGVKTVSESRGHVKTQ